MFQLLWCDYQVTISQRFSNNIRKKKKISDSIWKQKGEAKNKTVWKWQNYDLKTPLKKKKLLILPTWSFSPVAHFHFYLV